ncbi:MAG TPA: chemotaxis response regulator protein-glutamate methylesterase [Methylomirabilota bacterium]|jgi:two-component system chemotaxis response regulator CheB|nr:chemotaxis response regulator protein-glutamate methylesterase [Methylomirabilota bacterium]
MEKRIRVLIVDDSPVIRRLLATELARDRQVEVVGTAPDPYIARDMIRALKPDVLTLDVQMPGMDGLTFLEKLMRLRPMPVVMVSSFTREGCEMTLRALALGAVDFVPKAWLRPAPGTADGIADLARKIKVAAVARLRPISAIVPRGSEGRGGPLPHFTPRAEPARLVAVGASTGGTEAIRTLLAGMPPDGPPVVIVQHMPRQFTRAFAEHCDRECAIRVVEAGDGDEVRPGQALIAPGDRQMTVCREGARLVVRVKRERTVNGLRPSVDVLFLSVAETVGIGSVGILLTGMGADGARGLLAMRNAGARTIAQDEATSVVFGMPRAAIALGAVDHVLSLARICPKALELAGSSGLGARDLALRGGGRDAMDG